MMTEVSVFLSKQPKEHTSKWYLNSVLLFLCSLSDAIQFFQPEIPSGREGVAPGCLLRSYCETSKLDALVEILQVHALNIVEILQYA